MRSEPAANFQQNMIAPSRAHGLIEDLEAIQVRQKQSVRSPGVPPRSHKRVLQPVKKQPAIGQPRERIVKQIVLELLFRPLALGNIAIHNYQLRDFTFGVVDCARHGFQHPPTAVFVLDPVLQPFSYSSLPRFSCRFEHLEAIVGMDLLEGGSLAQLCCGVTQDPLVGGTVVQPPSIHVHESNHVRGVLGDDLEKLFILLGFPMDLVNPELLVDHQNGQRAQRNPPYFDFTMHSEAGSYHGFFWFYFINEHVLRFLNLRYPRDYNTVPRLYFWLFHLLWLFPWSLYFPAALKLNYRKSDRASQARLMALCWGGFVLAFFTFSTTQEYYSMPAYPAMALLRGWAMASAGPLVKYGTRAIAAPSSNAMAG